MKRKILIKSKYQKAWAVVRDDFNEGADIFYPLYETKKEALKNCKKGFGYVVRRIKIIIVN